MRGFVAAFFVLLTVWGPDVCCAGAQETTATTRVYEVSPDGSREYRTIQDALAAATDSTVRKEIVLWPGDYDGNPTITLTVDNTHIRGMEKEKVRIRGSIDHEQFSTTHSALINVRASNCSVENLVAENTALDHFTSTFKSSALGVWNTNDFSATNCRFVGYTDDEGYNGLAYDVVWVLNSQRVRFTQCEVYGSSDSFSVEGSTVKLDECKGSAFAAPYGGYFFWIGNRSHIAANDLSTSGIVFAYTLFTGHGTTVNLNRATGVRSVEKRPARPFYGASIDSSVNNVLNCVNVEGEFRESKGVTQKID